MNHDIYILEDKTWDILAAERVQFIAITINRRLFCQRFYALIITSFKVHCIESMVNWLNLINQIVLHP